MSDLEELLILEGGKERWIEITEDLGIAPLMRRLHHVLLDVLPKDGFVPHLKKKDTTKQVKHSIDLPVTDVTVEQSGLHRSVHTETYHREISIAHPSGAQILYRSWFELQSDPEQEGPCQAAVGTVVETISISNKDFDEHEIIRGKNVSLDLRTGKAQVADSKQTFTFQGKTLQRTDLYGLMYKQFEAVWDPESSRDYVRSPAELAEEDLAIMVLNDISFPGLEIRPEHQPGELRQIIPLSWMEPFFHDVLKKEITREDIIDEVTRLIRTRGAKLLSIHTEGELAGYQIGGTVKGFDGIYGLDSRYIWLLDTQTFLGIMKDGDITQALIHEIWESPDGTDELYRNIRKLVAGNQDRIGVRRHVSNIGTIVSSILPKQEDAYSECIVTIPEEETNPARDNYGLPAGSPLPERETWMHRILTYMYFQKPSEATSRLGDRRIEMTFDNQETGAYTVAVRFTGLATEQAFNRKAEQKKAGPYKQEEILER